jgi:hypothetical protein
VFAEKAVDGGLKVRDRAKDATLQTAFGELAKNLSTALIHEHEVGVK